jgi:3alpha(or 20beta)-hydroxysteroid dehydrogenase
MDIKDRTAIITAGVSGLGAATARAFVQAGGRVALLDLNRDLGEALSSELGPAARFFPLDVSHPGEVDEAVEKVEDAWGDIHIVENPYLNGECIRLDGALRMGFGRR